MQQLYNVIQWNEKHYKEMESNVMHGQVMESNVNITRKWKATLCRPTGKLWYDMQSKVMFRNQCTVVESNVVSRLAM